MEIRFPERFPELETPNLRLRQLRPSDADDVYRIFADPQVTRYYDLDTFADAGQATILIERQKGRFARAEGIRWGIAQRANDVVIGTVGLLVAESNCQGTLGYDLARPYWRRGIMFEALGIVLRYGFRSLNLNRIQALVMPPNLASANLLLKLGFREEGTLREYAFFKGQYQDLRCFSLLRREYAPG